jgi:hypothetical protein
MEKVDLKGTKPSDFNSKMLKKGQKVEAEHTDSPKKAETIAQQHAAEFPKPDKNEKIDSDYYDELDKLESKLKKKQTTSFDSLVKKIQTETSMAGAGGVFGDSPEIGAHGGQVGNTDWYATGDARNVWGNGKKKSKKCKSCKKPVLMPMAKRSFSKS